MKLNESAKETFDKVIKVFDEKAMSHAQVFQWHKEFKSGRESKNEQILSKNYDDLLL